MRPRLPPRPPRDQPSLADDTSAWILSAANLLSLWLGVLFQWDVSELIFVYWVQSVVIGASYFARILSLDKFSTANFTINDRPVAQTPAAKLQVAGFFALHYGL